MRASNMSLGILAAAVLLAGAGEALANKNIGGRDLLDRGRKECREEAVRENYEVRTMSRGEIDKPRVRFDMKLERRDERFDARCVYDHDARQARLDVQDGGGSGSGVGGQARLIADTRKECEREADRRELNVIEAARPRIVGDGNNRARQDLVIRRDGDRRDAVCEYRRGDERAAIEMGGGGNNQGSGGGGNNQGRGHAGSKKEAEDACVREVRNRNWRWTNIDNTKPDRTDTWKSHIDVEYDGSGRQYTCYYDARSRMVNLQQGRR